MTGYLKRLMGLMLVLSVSTWAQAVCPMMLLPQIAEHCGQHAAQPAAASSQSSEPAAEHDCCPRTRVRMQEQCERAKLSSCATAMSCCAVEREPASPSKVLSAAGGISVLGRVMPSALQAPSRAVTLELSDAGPPSRGVMSLKEDLRI